MFTLAVSEDNDKLVYVRASFLFDGHFRSVFCGQSTFLYIYVAPFLVLSMLSDQTASHLHVTSWGFEMRNTSIIFEPQILARNVKSFNRGLFMKSAPALVECICDVTMFIPGFVELIVTWMSLWGHQQSWLFCHQRPAQQRNSAFLCEQGVDWHVLYHTAGEPHSFQFTSFDSSWSLCLECQSVDCWVPNKTAWWACPRDCCS